MKDSGIEWIGEIPEDWEIRKVKDVFLRKKSEAKEDDPIVLSLARDGIKIRDILNNEGQLAESYYKYNPVEVGDFLINPMDLYSGANCNVSMVSGVISPAYVNLKAKNENSSRFFDYYFKTQYWSMALFAHGKGVSYENRWTLNNETLMNYSMPYPKPKEQQKIANFLDQQVSKIDYILEKTRESIEEYKKYKQSLITEAVTKGLNPDVEMKDSGIEWIGEIPRHWEVTKFKYIIQVKSGDALTNEQLDDEAQYPVYGGGRQIGCYNKYNVTDENILIGRVGANCGCITPLNGTAWATDNALIVSTNYNKKYVFYLLQSSKLNNLNEANAQPLITGTKVLNHKILVTADEEEQQQVIDFLDSKCTEIDSLISQKETLLSELETYKKSIIYECVTGKRKVD